MEQLGKYGFLRRDYLKNHRNSTYGMYYQIGEEHKEFCAEKTQDDDYYVLTLAAIANYERVRAEAERTNGADEELAGYYRQVEAACEGAGGVTGASDGRERRVTGEKSEDERVYLEISGKDTQAENGKTEVLRVFIPANLILLFFINVGVVLMRKYYVSLL